VDRWIRFGLLRPARIARCHGPYNSAVFGSRLPVSVIPRRIPFYRSLLSAPWLSSYNNGLLWEGVRMINDNVLDHLDILSPGSKLCGVFLQTCTWRVAFQSQRRITFTATEEISWTAIGCLNGTYTVCSAGSCPPAQVRTQRLVGKDRNRQCRLTLRREVNHYLLVTPSGCCSRHMPPARWILDPQSPRHRQNQPDCPSLNPRKGQLSRLVTHFMEYPEEPRLHSFETKIL
jgi:hypothetical protein